MELYIYIYMYSNSINGQYESRELFGQMASADHLPRNVMRVRVCHNHPEPVGHGHGASTLSSRCRGSCSTGSRGTKNLHGMTQSDHCLKFFLWDEVILCWSSEIIIMALAHPNSFIGQAPEVPFARGQYILRYSQISES